MKTLEALYQEILASEELKKSFAEAMEKKQMEEFLKANELRSRHGGSGRVP